MGALEFVPDRGSQAPEPTALDLGRLIETARSVVSGTLNDDAQEIRHGQPMPGPGEQSWLLKFDGVGPDLRLADSQQHTCIEHAYLLRAYAAGITMSETRLPTESGGRRCLSRRFDRVAGARIHRQSLCGINTVDVHARDSNDYAQLFTTADRLGLGEGHQRNSFGGWPST